jgi:DNA-binding response OmpR family regulator
MAVSTWIGKTIVVCEDDRSVLASIDRILRDEGFTVRPALDAPRALRGCLSIPTPSLLLLDVFITDIKGLDVYRMLRKCGGTMPVLLMTGYPIEYVEIDRIELGLGLIEKPFDADSLTRQVTTYLRQAPPVPAPGEPIFRLGEVAVNLKTHMASRGRRSFQLTDRELDILFHLLVLTGKDVSHDTLIAAYWDNDVSTVHKDYTTPFRTLRAKLQHRGETQLIEPTTDGWRMISPVEDLKRRLTWDYIEHRRSLGLPHGLDPRDVPKEPPERY